MTYDELSKLSSTMPRFHDLWLSGGEPFLRKDLAEVICLFYNNNGIRDVRIPTNGLPSDQTLKIVKSVLERCPELHLEIDISIDGFSETHDRIRAVPGNFQKALQTLGQLEQLRPEWPNLTVYLNSVITSENRNEIVQLGEYFKQHNDLDGHYFQIIRGDPKDPKLQTIDPESLKAIYQEVLPLNMHYVSKASRKKSTLGGVRKAFWKAGYVFSYDTQFRNYAYRTKWKMPCSAGQTSIVIDYNGDIRVCELRKPIGNLRKYGMDFGKFWSSIERKNEVRQVEFDQCFCTHICFMYDSMRHSKRVMLWDLPKLAIVQSARTLFSRSPDRRITKAPEEIPSTATAS
jgi:MoaA/NifB/PqqE/SkfB family radical SAM enzyme